MRRIMTDEVLQAKVAVVLLLMTVTLMLAGHLAEDRREVTRVASGISIAEMIGEVR